MESIDDDNDYLSEIFEIDWKYVRSIIRKEKIEKIYGSLGK